MMKPISTFGQTALRNANLRRMEGDLAQANNELATGKKTDVAKEIGANLIDLQTIRNQFGENEAFLRSMDIFEQRAGVMDTTFKEVTSAFQELSEVVALNAADPLETASFMQSTARNALDRVMSALGVSIGGRKLFSGENVTEAPLRALDDPGATISPAQMIEDVLSGTNGVDLGRALPAPATLRTVDFLANPPSTVEEAEELLARMDDVFQGNNAATPGLEDWSFEDTVFDGALGGFLSEIRLPGGSVQRQGMDAFSQGLRDVLQATFTLAFIPADQITDEDAYQTLLAGEIIPEPDVNDPAAPFGYNFTGDRGPSIISRLTTGLGALRRSHSELGQSQQIVARARQATEAQNAMFNNEIVRLEGVDRAEVTTRLLDIENQLQASYSATGRVMKLNLWNYVR